MGGQTIELRGSIQIPGDNCGSCGDTDRTTRGLSLACTNSFFQGVQSTDKPVRVATVGALGQAWVELPSTDALTAIEFLSLKVDQWVKLRIGAAPAIVTGSGGTFPTSFGGGEGLTFDLDGTSVSVTFQSGDQTAAQCAARINAACALLGLATPVATVASSGQLVLTGSLTGDQGSIDITGGSGRATLGLALGEVLGSGQDVDVGGVFMCEWPRTSGVAPARIQISGNALVSIVAAGRTST